MLDSYVFLALLAAFFWSLANLIDKIVLTDHIEKPVLVTFFTGLFGAATALFIPALGLVSASSAYVLTVSVFLGVIYIVPIYLYMKALELGEVSRIVPVFSLLPVFVAFLEFLILDTVFGPVKYAGMALAVTGSVIVSSENFGRGFFDLRANRPFWIIFLSTILFSFYSVGVRWLLQSSATSYWNVFFWSRLGSLIPVAFLLLHRPTRLKLHRIVSNAREHRLELMGFSEAVNNIGVLAQTAALSIGPAALVSTVSSAQPLMILVMVAGLSHIWKKDLGDDLSRKAVLIKTFSGLMIMAGIYLIK